MKEFVVDLGGKERRLRYTSRDAIALYKRFGRPVPALLLEDVWGLREAPEGPDGQKAHVFTAHVNPEAQAAVLCLGLRQSEPRITEEMLLSWLDAFIEDGGNTHDLVTVAVKAFFYSGAANGKRTDLEEAAKKAIEGLIDAKVSEGKAQTAAETESPTPA